MSKRKQTPQLPSMDELLGGTPVTPPPRQDPPTLPASREEKEKARHKKRATYQARYDLPPGMKDAIGELAQDLETTASQVAAYLLADALRRVERGEIDLEAARSYSRSPRNKYNLDVDF